MQFRRTGMGLQNRPVSRNVVSHKLAEDGPTRGGVTQGVGRVIVSAIAETACAAELVQVLLIRLKRRQFGKHSNIGCRAKRCIDCPAGSRRNDFELMWRIDSSGPPRWHLLVQARLQRFLMA
jgi:hypothetical protein